MKVRSDMAELIRAGHTDRSIAYRLHCHSSTVARARRALRMPYSNALTRLYAEAHPTGEAFKRRPWSPEEQAQHRADLLAALDGTADHRTPTRHLRAIPPAA